MASKNYLTIPLLMTVAQKAPGKSSAKANKDIVVDSSDAKKIKLKDFAGHKMVLYFYPKDSTPGCTLEGQEFSKMYSQFKKLGFEIFGISRDSVKSHHKFKCKYEFPFELLSDEKEELCKAFDVIKEKNMYGKKVMGIERSTFLLDEKGQIIHEWRKVKADGHAAEVLKFIQAI